MVTYEEMTELFIKAARDLGLATHPEFWLNTRSMEREFSCVCHTGSCEEEETRSSCLASFSWGVLDTALSNDGATGTCEFFHDADQDCAHLHTSSLPPLIVDLSYSLALNGTAIPDDALVSLSQLVKLQASEHSRRTTETRPAVSMVLRENRLYPEVLNLQQRVELPIWHPAGMSGLHDNSDTEEESIQIQIGDNELEHLLLVDEPHPEDWLPETMIEVCEDIMQVLAALETTVPANSSDCPQS
ncbi:hypothetical protein [Dictyobacter arantiisoli]|uniref:Uncharacterized protein n=1 Tax=Dictyobacter arantiisoli TaxID=2014874 RepID=A0A5A5TD05_9CHLR|nr:hypothetical protein [Dictyobacter arantiisoli]GCF09046.1 hypothetical protein KDI_26100 [Dictyobacter arantiisoli]